MIGLKYTKSSGEGVSDFSCTRDDTGNILTRLTDFGNVEYGYDLLNRLTSAVYSWKPAEIFTYDSAGNRRSSADLSDWQYDAANQLTCVGNEADPAFSFGYDNNGSLTAQIEANTGISTTFQFDYDNRMSEIQQNGNVIASYRYDHQSKRVKKNLFSGGVLSDTSWFLYGQEGLLAEYDGAGVLIKRYVWQPDRPWGTDPLWQEDASGSRSYYLNDMLGTPQKMLFTDLSASWESDWNSFGIDHLTLNTVENNLRFPGQYQDVESSLINNLYRQYDSFSGRYLQLDPVEIFGPKWNMHVRNFIRGDVFPEQFRRHYLYANDNPVRNIDPPGLYSWCGSDYGSWWDQDLIPDSFDVSGFWSWPGLLGGSVSFKVPCMNHDSCYGCIGKAQGKTKSQCDLEFYEGMKNECSKVFYPWRFNCYSLAYIYYSAVRYMGDNWFINGRKCCN